MPSPFPGMNPYLERATVWPSFHQTFNAVASFHLTAQLRPRYRVHLESRLYIHEPPAEDRFRGISDLGVKTAPAAPAPAGGAATVAPTYVTLGDAVEVKRVSYLAVRDVTGAELVAVVELLSPTNKYAGPDREQYLGKRNEILRSRTHLVEIDLLRRGPRMPPDELPTCDYCAVVSRVEERPRAGVWPWRLRDPIPTVPVPLRAGDPDATLDVRAVLDQIYDAGGYEDFLYLGPPEPQLSPDDAAWAAQFLPRPTS